MNILLLSLPAIKNEKWTYVNGIELPPNQWLYTRRHYWFTITSRYMYYTETKFKRSGNAKTYIKRKIIHCDDQTKRSQHSLERVQRPTPAMFL